MRYWTDFTCATTSNVSSTTQHCSVGRGVGVRVRRTDEEVERSMVVYHIFVSVPRTFGGYCSCSMAWLADRQVRPVPYATLAVG